MASRSKRMRQGKRGPSRTAPRKRGFSRPSSPRSVRSILSTEDRRSFSMPSRRLSWPRLMSSRPARIVVSAPTARSRPYVSRPLVGGSFSTPANVNICARRRARRRALFAFGRSGSNPGPRVRNLFSSVRC